MIELFGSQKSCSGTLLLHPVTLSALLGEEFYMYNIRAEPLKPGINDTSTAILFLPIRIYTGLSTWSKSRIKGAKFTARERDKLKRMGIRAKLEVMCPGYAEHGDSIIAISVEPVRGRTISFKLIGETSEKGGK